MLEAESSPAQISYETRRADSAARSAPSDLYYEPRGDSERFGNGDAQEHDRLEEQRRRLPESSYRRLFLNEWTEAEDRLTTIDDIRACVTLEGLQLPRPGMKYVVGLDIGLKHDRTVASVAHLHREDDAATVVLDRQETWAGTRSNPVLLGDVEAWLLEASLSRKSLPPSLPSP